MSAAEEPKPTLAPRVHEVMEAMRAVKGDQYTERAVWTANMVQAAHALHHYAHVVGGEALLVIAHMTLICAEELEQRLCDGVIDAKDIRALREAGRSDVRDVVGKEMRDGC